MSEHCITHGCLDPLMHQNIDSQERITVGSRGAVVALLAITLGACIALLLLRWVL